MPIAVFYVVVAVLAVVTTVVFVNPNLGMNTKGILIIISAFMLISMCVLVFSAGWWHILGFIATYVILLRIVAMLWTRSHGDKK